MVDLENRWNKDVIEQAANLVSITIGVNDICRRFDKVNLSTVQEFSDRYSMLISTTSKFFGSNIILCEPFILPLNAQMHQSREGIEANLLVIRSLATDFNLTLVPFVARMCYLAKNYGAELLAKDGIHPTKFGHSRVANIWLSSCANKF